VRWQNVYNLFNGSQPGKGGMLGALTGREKVKGGRRLPKKKDGMVGTGGRKNGVRLPRRNPLTGVVFGGKNLESQRGRRDIPGAERAIRMFLINEGQA